MCLLKYLLSVNWKFFRFPASQHVSTPLDFSPASLHRLHRYRGDGSSLQLNGTEACIVFGSVCSLPKLSGLTYSSIDSPFDYSLHVVGRVAGFFVRLDQTGLEISV